MQIKSDCGNLRKADICEIYVKNFREDRKMQLKLRKRLRNSGIAGMLILILCAGIFQSETGVVKAASDSQVVDGMTIEDGVVVDYEGTAEHVVIPDGVTGIGFSAFEK